MLLFCLATTNWRVIFFQLKNDRVAKQNMDLISYVYQGRESCRGVYRVEALPFARLRPCHSLPWIAITSFCLALPSCFARPARGPNTASGARTLSLPKMKVPHSAPSPQFGVMPQNTAREPAFPKVAFPTRVPSSFSLAKSSKINSTGKPLRGPSLL